MAKEDAVAASARGASFLILLQIGSRALTFMLNQILLRFVSPDLLGAAVQLELFVISILYFARESLRIATQRRVDGGVQAAVNLAYLAVVSGLPLGLAIRTAYLQTNIPNVPYFMTALGIGQLTALVELFSEPAYVAVQQKMLYKTRAAAEASAVILKTISTAGIVFWSKYRGINLGVLPFAVGELVYSFALTTVYIVRTRATAKQDDFTLFPAVIHQRDQSKYYLSLFSQPLLYLTASLYLQTGIKWLLTEGDKILIAALSTLEDQGMYALSANYGGLIARMIFRPVEDSLRNLFASLCSATTSSIAQVSRADAHIEKDSQDKNVRRAASVLKDILHLYSIASLIMLAVGHAAAPLLLQIVAGSRWLDSGAGGVLATYSTCIPLLAINGVSEAFVSATASVTELQHQSFWMAVFSVGFAASAFIFLRILELGAAGLVYANCVNMALRIIFNLRFASTYFKQRGVEFDPLDILPPVYLIAAVPFVSILLARPPYDLRSFGVFGRLAQVGVVAVVFTGVVVFVERNFLRDSYRRFRSR